MTRRRLRSGLLAALLAGLCLASAETARACAVCFGDPNSPMTRGANAAIAVMLGFIGCVLTGIVGVTGYWIVRARRLNRAAPPSAP